MSHEFKTHPEPFQAVWSGYKRYEVRDYDKDLFPNNVVVLKEWDPKKKRYTGREINATVSYVTTPGLVTFPSNIKIFGISPYQWIDPKINPETKKKT